MPRETAGEEREEGRGRRREEGGRRKEEGGRRKEEGGRRKEEGGRRRGGRRGVPCKYHLWSLSDVVEGAMRVPKTDWVALYPLLLPLPLPLLSPLPRISLL
jgi:hypothetical protein